MPGSSEVYPLEQWFSILAAQASYLGSFEKTQRQKLIQWSGWGLHANVLSQSSQGTAMGSTAPGSLPAESTAITLKNSAAAQRHRDTISLFPGLRAVSQV